MKIAQQIMLVSLSFNLVFPAAVFAQAPETPKIKYVTSENANEVAFEGARSLENLGVSFSLDPTVQRKASSLNFIDGTILKHGFYLFAPGETVNDKGIGFHQKVEIAEDGSIHIRLEALESTSEGLKTFKSGRIYRIIKLGKDTSKEVFERSIDFAILSLIESAKIAKKSEKGPVFRVFAKTIESIFPSAEAHEKTINPYRALIRASIGVALIGLGYYVTKMEGGGGGDALGTTILRVMGGYALVIMGCMLIVVGGITYFYDKAHQTKND